MSIKIPRHSFAYFALTNVLFLVMCLAIFLTDWFDDVTTKNGFVYYAEDTITWGKFRLMPLNVLVNVGYLVAGIVWLNRSRSLLKKSKIGKHESTFIVVSSWHTILYGPVQFLRIVFQRHEYAVLDQWVTPPFFMWMTLGFTSVADGRWIHSRNLICILVSLASYFLALISPLGFEITLGVHVVLVVLSSIALYNKFGDAKMRLLLIEGLLCCVGFVMLKVYDLTLIRYHVLFRQFSGHFWSKVLDVLQIHFALAFFVEGAKQSKRKLK